MMDRNQWRSPSFRERSPHPRHLRFQNMGGYGTPRPFSPQQWRPRHQSPKHHHHQTSFDGNMFSPQQRSPFDDFMTSTPYHGRGGRQPYHHRGGGRFNKRQSFGSPHFANDRNADDINNWISPEMWSDPWSHLTNKCDSVDSYPSHLLCTPSNAGLSQDSASTKFADTDFDVSSKSADVIAEDEDNGALKSKNDEVVDPTTENKSSIQETTTSTSEVT